MGKPLVTIEYKTADGKRICLEVSIEVKELLEQSDRQTRSQRRQDRRRHTEYIDGLTDTSNVLPQEDFADLLFRMDSYIRLSTAVNELPDAQRRKLMLHFVDNLTYRQIAAKEGASPAAIGRSIKRALRRLQKHLPE